jgi:hypothetical protein
MLTHHFTHPINAPGGEKLGAVSVLGPSPAHLRRQPGPAAATLRSARTPLTHARLGPPVPFCAFVVFSRTSTACGKRSTITLITLCAAARGRQAMNPRRRHRRGPDTASAVANYAKGAAHLVGTSPLRRDRVRACGANSLAVQARE